jgi:hypothetical protein
MIDPSIEELVPVVECRSMFPRRRRKSLDDPSHERALISYATLMRWCVQGDRRGRKLESLLVGGVRYTSAAAVDRFLAAAAAAEEGGPAETTKARARRAAQAKADAKGAPCPPPRKSGRKPAAAE